jgi:hypothetical protein
MSAHITCTSACILQTYTYYVSSTSAHITCILRICTYYLYPQHLHVLRVSSTSVHITCNQTISYPTKICSPVNIIKSYIRYRRNILTVFMLRGNKQIKYKLVLFISLPFHISCPAISHMGLGRLESKSVCARLHCDLGALYTATFTKVKLHGTIMKPIL